MTYTNAGNLQFGSISPTATHAKHFCAEVPVLLCPIKVSCCHLWLHPEPCSLVPMCVQQSQRLPKHLDLNNVYPSTNRERTGRRKYLRQSDSCATVGYHNLTSPSSHTHVYPTIRGPGCPCSLPTPACPSHSGRTPPKTLVAFCHRVTNIR